jgi:DNA processing protein
MGMNIDARDLLTLSTIPGVGPHRLRALINHFKSPRAVAEATVRQLVTVEGIERKTALTIARFYHESHGAGTRYASEQLSRLNRVDGRLVTFWDSEYPSNLKKIYDPPPFLFVRGTLTPADNSSVAIVGTRSPSVYGKQMAEQFAAGLASMGITVISGLARGIDTVAHSAALKAGGRTIPVIGSGIDVIYPPENRQLVDRILEAGALISEFEMGAKPDAGNFPRRNRIISGISLGTVVVETGANGGAMITATTALDQNRDVFAIPSAVNSKIRSGANLLIKDGRALLVETVDDILEELGPRLKHIVRDNTRLRKEPPPDLSLFERQVLDAMGDDPIHIDALAERAGVSVSDALVHLLSLEFKRAVRQIPGKYFARF